MTDTAIDPLRSFGVAKRSLVGHGEKEQEAVAGGVAVTLPVVPAQPGMPRFGVCQGFAPLILNDLFA